MKWVWVVGGLLAFAMFVSMVENSRHGNTHGPIHVGAANEP